MESDTLRQRNKNESDTPAANDGSYGGDKHGKKKMMAKRGLKSLAVAVALPVSLTLLNIYLFGASEGYYQRRKQSWLPSLLVLHTACVGSSLLLGLAAWLFWADGGFHKKPTALYLYLANFVLGLVWDPIVFRMGANWVGLVLSLCMIGSLVGCSRMFKQVNAVAGDLVKPCLPWAGMLAFVNYKLVTM